MRRGGVNKNEANNTATTMATLMRKRSAHSDAEEDHAPYMRKGRPTTPMLQGTDNAPYGVE